MDAAGYGRSELLSFVIDGDYSGNADDRDFFAALSGISKRLESFSERSCLLYPFCGTWSFLHFDCMKVRIYDERNDQKIFGILE